MKKLKTHIPILLMLLSMSFVCATCEKDENGNKVTYYKTIGEGYIYDGENNRPLKGVKITMISSTSSNPGGTMLSLSNTHGISETITTNENGYYKIRFLKRINGHKVNWYRLGLLAAYPSPMLPPPPPFWFWDYNPNGLYPSGELYSKDIKDKNIIVFDTIKYYPSK